MSNENMSFEKTRAGIPEAIGERACNTVARHGRQRQVVHINAEPLAHLRDASGSVGRAERACSVFSLAYDAILR
jgi:hypothetical protein